MDQTLNQLSLSQPIHITLVVLLAKLPRPQFFRDIFDAPLHIPMSAVDALELGLKLDHALRSGSLESLGKQLDRAQASELGDLVLGQELAEVVDLDAQGAHQRLDILLRDLLAVQPELSAVVFAVDAQTNDEVLLVLWSPL